MSCGQIAIVVEVAGSALLLGGIETLPSTGGVLSELAALLPGALILACWINQACGRLTAAGGSAWPD